MTIRVGVLGAGAMGAEHVWCFGQMPDVRVVSVFSREASHAAAVAEAAGAEVVTDAATLITDPSLDAVDVCLPTPAHAPFVAAALEAGKHVFCETPLTLDLAEGRALRDIARRTGRLLQVGLLMRSISACRLVNRLATSGEHGRLLHLSTERLGSYLRASAPDHKAHYSDPTTELMTFDLDFIGWLFGPPATISAVATSDGGEAAALLGYEGGRSATVLASGVMPASFPFTAGFRAVFETAAVVARTVIANRSVSSVTRLFREDAVTEPPLAASNPYQIELERFVGCIRGKADAALLDVDRALEALELSLGVQRSICEGGTIRFGERD